MGLLSRSAIVKLKAILIIDLIVVAAATGVYLYLQDQGMITNAATPAKFTLTDLSIDPPQVYAGESVQISVNITNIGDLEGNYTVEFKVNDVLKSSQNVTLAGNSTSEVVAYSHLEMTAGTYNVTVGDKINMLSGEFIVNIPPPDSSKIILSNLISTPYEIWPNESTTVSVIAENKGTETDTLFIRLSIDDVVVNTTIITMDAGASQTITFAVNSTVEARHVVKINTLQGSFVVVKEGYHTLTINRSGGGSKTVPITLNGEQHPTPYTALLPIGEYSVSVPDPFDVGTGVLAFSYWSDGSHSSSRTFTLSSKLILVVTYTLISGYACCPSLYFWNGTGYQYVTEVSNSGWLGYIGYINSAGTIVFKDGNPYDYVKMDSSLLKTKDGYYDFTLTQQWNELFYLDQAYLLCVDHPVGTDAYMSMTSYLSDGSTGKIYTVTNQTTTSPISAINEKGENVLLQLRSIDGLFTPGINGYDSVWNNITLNQLTLDLGNLNGASEIKLVLRGIVDWGPADSYYKWIESFQEAAAKGLIKNDTAIAPAPYLEVKAANGTWIRVNQDIPLPSDYRARTYTVNITGIFPKDVTDYQIRFNNYWNVTYDYIGIDTSNQAYITTQELYPSSAVLSQLWETTSTSTGAFTRYGDVLPVLQNADDMFVVGRQGDQVNILFPAAKLTDPEPGMVRDYFFVVASWFKDPPGEWGYGFTFTVDPMPFMDMSGFPYPSTESYPYDAAHLAYIQQYNTRVIS
jgi:hypothetical protein